MQVRLSAWFARRVGIAASAALLIGIAALLAMPAVASQLADVRVGTHPGFTRVVLELDGPAGYRLEPPESDVAPELRLELDARSTVREISAKSPLVRSVRVEPGPRGSVVRIALASRDVHVTEMILSKPTRIVLDLRQVEGVTVSSQAPRAEPAAPTSARAGGSATGAAEAASEAATAVIAGGEAAAGAAESAGAGAAGTGSLGDVAPESLERAAARALGEAPERAEAAAKTAAAETAEAAEGAASAAGEQAAQAAGELGSAAEAATEPTAGALAEARETMAEPEAGSASGAAAAEADEMALARGDLAAPEARGVPAPSLREERAAEEPSGALAVRRPIEAVPLSNRSESGGLPAFLSSPTGIGVVLGAIAVLLFAWMRLRRRPGTIEAIGPSLDEEEGLGLGLDAVAAPAAEASESQAAAPFEGAEQEASSMEEASFPTPVGAAGAETGSLAPIGGTMDAGIAAGAAGAAAEASGSAPERRIEELERRLAHLETRMEEMVEARERMERQLAAQTEELRVQRAAIARTQRVVRSMARPEDMATEPVPRSPDRPGN